MSGDDLRNLSREDLIARATRLGIARAESMSDGELIGEIERRDTQGRGWLGRARDLVAKVVERGLHIPDAAKILRGAPPIPPAPPPLPTVTLAEIYAAQGHHAKAVTVLDQVLEREPEHAEARSLRERFAALVEKPRPEEPVTTRSPSVPPPPPDEPPSTDVASRPSLKQSEVVCLATDPTTAYVYWEVRPIAFARARWRDPRGSLALRVVTMQAHHDAEQPTSGSERDVPVETLLGDCFIRNLEPGGAVRICVGWLGPSGFAVLAVAPDMTMPRDYRALTRAIAPDPRLPAAPMWQPPAKEETPAVRAAGDRLRSYLGAPQPAPRHFPVVHTTTEVIERRWVVRYGGASDLYRELEEVTRDERHEVGGASDLFGGASDLYSPVAP